METGTFASIGRAIAVSGAAEKTRPLQRKSLQGAAFLRLRRKIAGRFQRAHLAGEARQHAGKRSERRVDMLDGDAAVAEDQAGLRLRAQMERRESV